MSARWEPRRPRLRSARALFVERPWTQRVLGRGSRPAAELEDKRRQDEENELDAAAPTYQRIARPGL
jgi:hypothetical protein